MKKKLTSAGYKLIIARLALETEVKRQCLKWQEIPNDLLTLEQQDEKYKSLVSYINATLNERDKIKNYNEYRFDGYYEKRSVELSKETVNGFETLQKRYAQTH